MATRTIDRESARDAVIIDQPANAALMQLGDPDSESDWDAWIDSIKESEGSGTVRAYKLPLGPDGNPNPSVRGSKQIHLGSWPHSQFDFDDLLTIIKREYLKPGETAGIRLTGVRAGVQGTPFNRILTLMRPMSSDSVPVAGSGSELALILKNQGEMLERVLNRPSPVIDPLPPVKSTLETMKEFILPFAPILGPALAAYIGRPREKSDLGAMLDIVDRMQDMRGERNERDADEPDSIGGIIRAVAPQAIQLFTAMAQRPTQQTASVPAIRRVQANMATPNRAPIPTPAGVAPTLGQENNQPMADTTAHPGAGPSPLPPVPTEENSMLAQLAPQLEQLANMAENGADPGETAKLVLDTLPQNDDFDGQFYDLISDPAKFGRLALISPKVKQNWAWFEQVRVALVAEFEDEPEPGNPSPP